MSLKVEKLFPECIILQADGIRIIIDCMTIAQQPIVLSQACRALGALAILPANRARIAAANGVRILVGLLGHGRLLSPASESISSRSTSHEFEDIRTNELVQEAALAALTNIAFVSARSEQDIAYVSSTSLSLGIPVTQIDSLLLSWVEYMPW